MTVCNHWRGGARRALVLALGAAMLALSAPASAENSCRPGSWIAPATGAPTAIGAVMERALASRVVLLGESHASMEHHRWQAYMLAALHARHPDLVVGFEMFPRAAQAALDQWTEGALDEKTFLARSRWAEVWGYDEALYRPLLHFVRQHGLKAVALNVARSLVSRAGREGWAAIPEGERHGIGAPAPASEAYRRSLAEVFAEKMRRGIAPDGAPTKPDIEAILKSDAFNRFVAGQQTWDRAMAEALAGAARAHPRALIVGIVGSGHVEFGHGIPHQLADLGIRGVLTLLPAEPDAACAKVPPGIADALFVVAPEGRAGPAPARPRLGVMIAAASGGVRVRGVLPDSVAAAATIEKDDVIVSAAGFPVAKTGDLIDIIRRQAPGTWLPLEIRRGDRKIDLVAKFPQSFGGQ